MVLVVVTKYQDYRELLQPVSEIARLPVVELFDPIDGIDEIAFVVGRVSCVWVVLAELPC